MAGEPSDDARHTDAGHTGAGRTAGRTAAYAELVAAVLDLRSTAPTRHFDSAVLRAVADGRLTEELARELKWLQRQSLRELVAHAERVLPATLVALEGMPEGDSDDYYDGPPRSTDAASVDPTAGGEHTTPEAPPMSTPVETAPQPAPNPPVDLTARRLLVAGLRPIDDPPFP